MGLVVEDEAHHCYGSGNKARQKLDNAVKATRFLELSATFPKHIHVHFKVSMRRAIDEGVVSDYRLRVIQLSNGDKQTEMLRTFEENHVAWGPTLAVFNNIENMKAFAEKLREAGVRAECVTGVLSSERRRQTTQLLESGMVDSDINKRQLAQRASRLHNTKPYYNIVLFVQKEVEDDVSGLLRSFCDDDPASRPARDADLITDTLFTRLGEILVKRDLTQEKVDALIALGQRPKKGEALYDFIYRIKGNWTPVKGKIKLSPEQIASLEASWFKTVIDQWKATKPKSSLSFAEKLKIVCSVKSEPAFSECASGFAIGMFVAYALQENGQGRYKPLLQVKWFTDALEALNSKREDEPDMKTKLEWLRNHGKAPQQKDTITKTYNNKPFEFKIGTFWMRVVIRAAIGKESDLEKELLQGVKWYHDAVTGLKIKQKKRICGKVPYDIQVGWLCELPEEPAARAQFTRSYNDKTGIWNAGRFWTRLRPYWTDGKHCTKQFPHKLKEKMNNDCTWLQKHTDDPDTKQNSNGSKTMAGFLKELTLLPRLIMTNLFNSRSERFGCVSLSEPQQAWNLVYRLNSSKE